MASRCQFFHSLLRFFSPSLQEGVLQNPKRPLHVEKIAPLHYPQLEKAMGTWQKIAQEKELLAISQEEQILFSASRMICSYVERFLHETTKILQKSDSEAEWTKECIEAYACKDGKGREQGMMIVQIEPDALYIEYLVTHPHNIRSPLNQADQGRVERAGTTLIHAAEDRMIELGKKCVHLSPLPSAKPFYQKLGFEHDASEMFKTAEKIGRKVTPLFANAA